MTASPDYAIDLSAYCERIGYAGGHDPSLATLQALHFAHATHVPFENIDVILKRPIRLDLPSLEDKLVKQRRGGYCFEQNLLFAHVLQRLGFAVDLLQARVRFNAQRVLPRTHLCLAVTIEGQPWLTDLGFGSRGLMQPMPVVEGEHRQHGWSYALAREGAHWVLRALVGEVWHDLYVFDLQPQLPVDFEPPNHYVSTHPESRFVQTLTVQRVSPAERLVLRNTELTTTTPTGETKQTIDSHAELLELLASRFDLPLPGDARLWP
ncbi:MAG: arylamine N-acetyltransferase [Planctomycetes bacterium]|nr:arylamine N-acetyltransferase [Planctomycetota bacterium]